MRSLLFLSLSLGILGSALSAAPWPQALKQEKLDPECNCEGHCGCGCWGHCGCCGETITAPPKKLEPTPYDHLPSEAVCRENYWAAGQWLAGLRKDAEALGYYTRTPDPEIWDGAPGWVGGGWTAKQMRQEVEECEHLERVWEAAWTVRWTERDEWNGMSRCEWADRLVSLIGAEAYVRGQLPPPVPVWRVPRR